MSILVDEHTQVIVQGITGNGGSHYTAQMLAYKTNIVAGVTPGKGGDWIHGKPIFDNVRSAVDVTGADASVIFVPAVNAADAICEAIDARLRLIVCVTDGIPHHDMLRVRELLQMYPATRLLGPGSAGILTPDHAVLGTIPPFIARSGHVGVVSHSSTLMYDVVYTLTQAGIGQSNCLSVGADRVGGMSLVDVMSLFEDDSETRAIVLIGDVFGAHEVEAAHFVHSVMSKPVYGYIVGKSLVASNVRQRSVIDLLRSSGIFVVETPLHLAKMLALV